MPRFLSTAWVRLPGSRRWRWPAAGDAISRRRSRTEIAAVHRRRAVSPVSKAVWADVQRFYAQRMHAPRWVRDGEEEQTEAALRAVQRAPDHGLMAADYGDADLPRRLRSKQSIEDSLGEDVATIARLDVQITTTLLTLGRDVAVGRTSPAAIDKRWKAARSVPDLAASLAAAADAGPLDGWLDTVRPVHPEYAALQAALRVGPDTAWR